MLFSTFTYGISRNYLMNFNKLKMCSGLYIKFHPDVLLTLEKHIRTKVVIASSFYYSRSLQWPAVLVLEWKNSLKKNKKTNPSSKKTKKKAIVSKSIWNLAVVINEGSRLFCDCSAENH